MHALRPDALTHARLQRQQLGVHIHVCHSCMYISRVLALNLVVSMQPHVVCTYVRIRSMYYNVQAHYNL